MIIGGRPASILTTPIPIQAMGGRGQFSRGGAAASTSTAAAGSSLLKPGVSVQQIKLSAGQYCDVTMTLVRKLMRVIIRTVKAFGLQLLNKFT